MTERATHARVHRFGESIAVYFNHPQHTVYVGPEVARELAAQLLRYAHDVDHEEFAESGIGSTNIDAAGRANKE